MLRGIKHALSLPPVHRQRTNWNSRTIRAVAILFPRPINICIESLLIRLDLIIRSSIVLSQLECVCVDRWTMLGERGVGDKDSIGAVCGIVANSCNLAASWGLADLSIRLALHLWCHDEVVDKKDNSRRGIVQLAVAILAKSVCSDNYFVKQWRDGEVMEWRKRKQCCMPKFITLILSPDLGIFLGHLVTYWDILLWCLVKLFVDGFANNK
jgi:hypothetical protein